MKGLLETLRISCAGVALCALTMGGCIENGSSDDHEGEHADHADHGDHSDATGTVDEHAGHDHGQEDADTDEKIIRTDVYEGVLGELVLIPDGSSANLHPKIHHVQIPDFKRQDGTVGVTHDGIPGMRSMTMEFPLAEGVSIDGFNVGDKVQFSFRVNWGGSIAWEMTEIKKIDPGTVIDFSNAKAEAP